MNTRAPQTPRRAPTSFHALQSSQLPTFPASRYFGLFHHPRVGGARVELKLRALECPPNRTANRSRQRTFSLAPLGGNEAQAAASTPAPPKPPGNQLRHVPKNPATKFPTELLRECRPLRAGEGSAKMTSHSRSATRSTIGKRVWNSGRVHVSWFLSARFLDRTCDAGRLRSSRVCFTLGRHVHLWHGKTNLPGPIRLGRNSGVF